jgi:uncharacterized protein
MSLSLVTLLERMLPASRGEQDADWFARGVAAHEKRRYLKALEAWRRASAQGDVESDYRIGLLYARGEGVVRSLPDAVRWYRRAAEAGHTEAQFQLGLIYLNGAGAGTEGPRHWFEAASQQNSEAAQQNLNMLFPNGIAVEKDPKEAKRWIWAAAAAGKVEAQAVLGDVCRHGVGVPQDYNEAQHWYWLAAQQGVGSAQFSMGDIYYQGLGVEVDHRAAAEWYEMAAKNGDPRAQVALASMYLTGQGKLADQKEAGRLFVQAAEQGEARGLYQAALMHLRGEGLPKDIDKAETYLRKSAKQSYLSAIISLAQFYAHGNGIEPDLREAAVWYLKAAELGDVQSQFIIGRLYATGSGVPTNLRESARWFLRAAEQGNSTAAHNIATYYAKGTGIQRDVAKSVEWYQAAAAAGVTASQVQLGKIYSVGDGVPRDLTLATDWLEKAAQSGDPEAKTALALLHLQDDGATRDPSRAEELLKQAADGGDTAAAMQLGHLYSGKYAVEAKSGDAIRWYTKAAEGGTIEAQHVLGMLYLNGRGVQKNPGTAASWIEKAANNGHAPSQFQLAVLYCTAQGVPKDLAQAVSWYEKAAESGHPVAQYNLAVMLSKGQGCEADDARAIAWFQKAAEQGVVEAKRALATRRGERPRSPDDNAGRSLDQKTSSESVPHSTTREGTNLATAQTSSPAYQPTSNKDPSQSSISIGTTPAAAAEPSQPPAQTKTAPQKVASQDASQNGPLSRTRDHSPDHNRRRPEARGGDAASVGELSPATESPSRGPSDVPRASWTAGNSAAPPSPGVHPEASVPGDRSQVEPSVPADGPTAISSQVEKSTPADKAGDYPSTPRPLSKHVNTSANSPTHRVDRTEVQSGSNATLPQPEDPSKPHTRDGALSVNMLTGHIPAAGGQPSVQVSATKPDAAISVARPSRGSGTHARPPAAPPKSTDEVAGPKSHSITQRARQGATMAYALDDDVGAKTPTASSTDDKTRGLSEGSATERRGTNDQDAMARAMSEIGNQLREVIRADLDVPPPRAAIQLEQTAARDRHQLAPKGPDAANLLGRLAQLAIALEPKRSLHINASVKRDDTALKDVGSAMAELGISPPTSGVLAESPSDRQTRPPDTQSIVTPNFEPAELDTAGLKSVERKFGEPTTPRPALACDSSPHPMGGGGHSSTVIPRDGSGPSARRINLEEAPTTSAPRPGREEAAAELRRAMAQLGAAPIGLFNTDLAALTHAVEKHPAAKRSEEAAGRPTSYVDTPPKPADSLPDRPRSGEGGTGPTLHPPADGLKSVQTVDSFLTDLTRQLDGIDLLSGRGGKR